MTAFPTFPSDGQIYTVGSRSWTYNEAQDGWILNRGGPTGPQGIQGPTGPMGVLLTSLTVDTFAGDGITTQFTLSIIPQSVYNMIVDVDGLVQTATVNYTVSTNTILFSTAPILGSSITVVHFITGSAIPGPTGPSGLIGPTGPRTGFTGPTGPVGSTILVNPAVGNTNLYPTLSTSTNNISQLYANNNVSFNPDTVTLQLTGNLIVDNASITGGVDISGTVVLKTTNESVTTLNSAGGLTDHDYSLGSIFNHNTPVSNINVNVTNFSLMSNHATKLTLLINQGINPYIANAIVINGEEQLIKWKNGTEPEGNSNKKDIINFNILNINASSTNFTVLGELITFG